MRFSRWMLLAATCGMVACQRPAPESGYEAEPGTQASTTDSTNAVLVPAPTPPQTQSAHDLNPSLAPPPSEAPTDAFVGWYFEKGGRGMLVGCGQALPLEVTDAAFLHQLNVRRGGSTAPVYVRLDVRPGAGSKLEVASVQQFGVDEGPAPDCPLSLAP